ncbi:HTH domain-containing protein [Halovenus aranensis]|uniref:Taxis protein CheF n=1 Tax=Halovenus aranensis TaxID=890420 RepID=A0A1G8RUM7_9EURY|nr:CheF family chemotaxis protein [Halovenus aranensis]SDJ20678.1 HTH domain-containing protein [Halovenus aranensis]
MSESVIADFVATFDSNVLRTTDPVKGRVLLSEKRLVLAVGDNDKLPVPLTSIFDVAVGQVPDELDGFFDATVTVAFRKNDKRFVAAIEAPDDKIEKFSNVLFKALLNGTDMTVKHPARVGGRVTDAEFSAAKLFLKPKQVEFRNDEETVAIRLAAVTEFDQTKRRIAGTKRPVLDVKHMPRGDAMLTQVTTDSPRKMSLLGRYLRLEYSDLMAELKDLTLTEDEKELLVAVYSGAGNKGMSLPQIIGKDPTEVTMLLNDLEDEELVVDASDGTKLTPKGQVLVNRHLEDINA